MSFDFICKKKLCHGKKAVTFAYDIEKNRIIYQNDENEISHLLARAPPSTESHRPRAALAACIHDHHRPRRPPDIPVRRTVTHIHRSPSKTPPLPRRASRVPDQTAPPLQAH